MPTQPVTQAQPTTVALARLAALAGRLQARGASADAVARALVQLTLCLFCGAFGRLPVGWREVFAAAPAQVLVRVGELLRGLVAAEAPEPALPLMAEDMGLVAELVGLDWSAVEPAILGVLFERGLEPERRSRLGAHYSDRGAIARVLEPVMLAPLRRELAAVQASATAASLSGFLERLRAVRVLDPSCGAGNFLVVALQSLRELERVAIEWGARALGIDLRPGVDARVVLGLEINPQAAALARLTVWIAELQWSHAQGLVSTVEPSQVRGIECRDALVESSAGAAPRRASWPDAEFIVGNPPFLGGKKLRAGLGDAYVDALFSAWQGRVPREADLGTYFHEMARERIAAGRCKRAGLLASQGIRGGANLEVLRKIKASGDIFMAWSDQPWIVDGAAVRVSIVGQDDGSETRRCLDGVEVAVIRADLTGDGADLTRARRLAENLGLAFMGDTKGGAFDVLAEQAATLLAGSNREGRCNREVVVPWVNGIDVLRRPRGRHIIDFGVDMSEQAAAEYVLPFAHVRAQVLPERRGNKRASYRERWWIHVEARPGLRAAIGPLRRFIATPTVGRHRIFVWLERPTLPDHQLIVVASEDAYAFGVLHSRAHELWSLRLGTRLGMGNDPRYTPTTTFETFPFPWPLTTPEAALDGRQQELRRAIAAAAEGLDAARRDWLAAASVKPRTLTALYNARPVCLVDAHAALDRAVMAAYGWSPEIADGELLARLLARNLERPARAR
jgi:hypothetical protein